MKTFWNGKVAVAAAVVGVLMVATLATADSGDTVRNASRVRKGFAIAPVALDMTDKNPDLVGLGSYLVNTNGCNDCHSASNQTSYVGGGNPYFGQPTKVNPEGYLGGGQDFGPFVTLDHLYTRNLTPDKTGLPVGGLSFDDFVTVMRTGRDGARLHPNCSPTVTTNCLPPPFKGDVLQIMPWPLYAQYDDYDLLAIYTYLRAIPCVAGPADKNNLLHHDCK